MVGIVFLALGYVLSQFYRSFLAVLSPVLGTDIGMQTSQLSTALSAWFILFALSQFPVGYCLDKYGPRRTASIMLFFGGGGGSIWFALANSGFDIIVAMGLIGIGCAPVLMASFYVYGRKFSARNFAFYSSLLVGFGTLGNVMGSVPLALAIGEFGWRNIAFVLAMITACIAAAIFILLIDPEQLDDSDQKGGLLDILKIKELWFIIPIITVNYSIPGGIRGLWAGPYLQDVFGSSVIEIGSVTLYMAIALSLGSFFYGPLDRIFNTRKWIVFVGNLFVLGALLWLAYMPISTIAQVTIVFVIIGFFGSSYALIVAHGKEFIPKHLLGRGVTLLNFFSIGGVGLFQLLSGVTVSSYKQENVAESGYTELFLLYAISLAIMLAIYFFSQDRKPNN